MQKNNNPRIFYGWWVVIAISFCNLIVVGTGTFSFGFFVKPLQEQFGWNRGEIMSAFTISFLCMALAQLITGRLTDKFGARKVIFTGGLIMGLGFVISGLTKEIWHLYAGYILVGIGASAAGTVPASVVVSHWFNRKRGLATGVMSVGVGAGGFVFGPVVGNILIPQFNWNGAFIIIGLITFFTIMPLALLVIRTRPKDMGLVPDGNINSDLYEKPKIASITKGMTLKMALGTSTLWLIALAYFLSSFSFMAVLQNQVLYLQDSGFNVATAAAAISAISVASAIGKFTFGWLSDRIPAKYTATLGLCLQVISIALLLFIVPQSPTIIIWIYAILFGLGMGSWLPTMSIMTGRQFGLVAFGSIFGVISLLQTLGASSGPVFAAAMFDYLQSYKLAFSICLASYAVSIPALLMLRKPK